MNGSQFAYIIVHAQSGLFPIKGLAILKPLEVSWLFVS